MGLRGDIVSRRLRRSRYPSHAAAPTHSSTSPMKNHQLSQPANAPSRWLAEKLARGASVASASHKSVGLAHNAIPRELLYAHGMEPVWVEPPLGASTATANMHLESRFPQRDRAMLSQVLDGRLSQLELLIFGREQARLYYFLAEFTRRGQGADFPLYHHFDLIPQHDPTVEQYNANQMLRLK